MDLWSVIGNMSALATLCDFLLNKGERGSALTKDLRIEKSFQDIIDYSQIAYDIHSAADKVDQYISEHKSGMIGCVLFDEEARDSFINTFFDNNPSLIVYKNDVVPLLDEYLNRLEHVLSVELSTPQRILLHSQIDNNQLLKEIILILKEIIESKEEYQKKIIRYQNDNIRYSTSFCETLFLHKERNDRVNLQNLFVMQKYVKSNGNEFTDTSIALDREIKDFINGPSMTMIIEGDGGSGKSSLVSWLSYHYCIKDNVAQDLFGNRNLITVRLRDIDRSIIQKRRLLSAILMYLGFRTLDELVKLNPNAVIVLDGFDELCMIEGISNYENLLSDLFRKSLPNYKFIITTRPKYINFESPFLNFPIVRIYLNHFDKEKREEWIGKYITKCGEHVSEEVADYILRDYSEDEIFICDTPMTLYMILSKDVPVESLSNQWELYNNIFAQELSRTEYNSMIPNEDWNYNHPVYEYKELLYQISEEIAYIMYQSGNKRLYVTETEIVKIIKKITNHDLSQETIKSLSERCYALCAYWKADARAGFVEFYHNNIRDFFLSEWIYRHINMLIKDVVETSIEALQHKIIDSDVLIQKIILKILDFANDSFPFATLTSQSCKFIYLRSLSYTGKAINRQASIDAIGMLNSITHIGFPYVFSTFDITSHLFNEIFTSGAIYPEKKDNPVQAIINTIICCAQIFRYSAEPFLRNKMSTKQYLIINNIKPEIKNHYYYAKAFHDIEESINNYHLFKWWVDVNRVNQNGLFSFLFTSVFKNQRIDINGTVINLLDNSDLSGCDLNNADLRGIPFISCNLSGVQFQDSLREEDNIRSLFEEVRAFITEFERRFLEGDYRLTKIFFEQFWYS